MSLTLAQQRCLNHPVREAVCRCPQCTRYFCRECATEHDGRLLCRNCLALQNAAVAKSARAAWVIPLVQAVAGCLLLWGVFYYFGSVLASLPADFRGAAN